MKKLLLLLSLIFISLNVSAGWKKIASNYDSSDFYIHKDSIEKSGGYSYIWILSDKKKSTPLSYKTLVQVDCGPLKQIKTISSERFKMSMGKGKGTEAYFKPGWMFIPPDNPIYKVFKYAC